MPRLVVCGEVIVDMDRIIGARHAQGSNTGVGTASRLEVFLDSGVGVRDAIVVTTSGQDADTAWAALKTAAVAPEPP